MCVRDCELDAPRISLMKGFTSSQSFSSRAFFSMNASSCLRLYGPVGDLSVRYRHRSAAGMWESCSGRGVTGSATGSQGQRRGHRVSHGVTWSAAGSQGKQRGNRVSGGVTGSAVGSQGQQRGYRVSGGVTGSAIESRDTVRRWGQHSDATCVSIMTTKQIGQFPLNGRRITMFVR